ncbi:MAG: permease prefix domain 1-containing protein [Dehalococcoidia bacterium]
MNPIDGYLNEVSWAMGGSFAEQQAARDELRGHIRDQVRELQLDGVDGDAAIGQAVRDLGDATLLGRSLRSSRGKAPLRRPVTRPAGALILERRSAHHLPARMLLALAAMAVMTVAVSIVYVWP